MALLVRFFISFIYMALAIITVFQSLSKLLRHGDGWCPCDATGHRIYHLLLL